MKTYVYEFLPKGSKTQLGLIVLQSDTTLEDEFREYFGQQNVSLFASRIPFENEVTKESLQQMEGHLADTVSLFPLETQFESIGYACTSGALHIGSGQIEKLVKQHSQCQHVTNPMKAALSALDHINAKKIAFLAPYSKSVTQTMVEKIEGMGVTIASSATFDESQDVNVGRISPESIYSAAVSLIQAQPVDAIFIACTNMKCAHIIHRIEEETGVTALSSNLALAWPMARSSGAPLKLNKMGRLCS